MAEPPGARGAPGWAAARFDRRAAVERWVGGHADLREGHEVSVTTRFRWFSVTKLVTAMVALDLAERGALSLDDPAHRYVGWLPPAPTRTVRSLLCHAGGVAVPNPIGWARPPGVALRSPEALTREVFDAHRRAHRAPSTTDARYSNLGYLLLGRVIEAAAGEPYRAAATRRVLGPLGLSASFDARGAAVGHERLFSARALAMSVLFLPRTPRLVRYAREGWIGLAPYAIEGDAYGGLVGSLDALVTLGRALMGSRWESMRAPVSSGPDGRFGLGPWIYDGGWLGHGGSAGGYRAELLVHPGRGVGVAVLANGGDAAASEVAERIRAEL